MGERRFAGLPLLVLALSVFGVISACAQTPVELPNAPQTQGTINGTVIEVDGTLAAGAQITLTTEASTEKRPAIADSEGKFTFSAIPAGKFNLIITLEGFEPGAFAGVLHAGEQLEVPQITLRVATAKTDVVVTMTQVELAETEIKAEEKQRMLGFAPNFFVSYNFNAAPLIPRQKLELSFRSIIDPVTIGISAATAGIEQARNIYPGFGDDAPAYGKRFGASFGDVVIGNLLGGAVFPILMHQDPRYFYKGTGTKKSRFFYALSTAVIARGDNGKWQPAYASLAGDLSAAAISNVYYPASDRNGASLTIANGFLGIAYNGIGNVLQEFLFRKLSTHVPPQGQKP